MVCKDSQVSASPTLAQVPTQSPRKPLTCCVPILRAAAALFHGLLDYTASTTAPADKPTSEQGSQHLPRPARLQVNCDAGTLCANTADPNPNLVCFDSTLDGPPWAPCPVDLACIPGSTNNLGVDSAQSYCRVMGGKAQKCRRASMAQPSHIPSEGRGSLDVPLSLRVQYCP